MDKKDDLFEVAKTEISLLSNAANKEIQIWACKGSPTPPNKKAVWTIPGYTHGLTAMTATVQECIASGIGPFLGDVQFTLYNAAISSDGSTVRLIFEHNGQHDLQPYASIWFAQGPLGQK